MSDPQREMTLDEWVERLPECHSARKEYVALKAKVSIQAGEKDEQATQGTPGPAGKPEGPGRPDNRDSVLERGSGAAVEVTSKARVGLNRHFLLRQEQEARIKHQREQITTQTASAKSDFQVWVEKTYPEQVAQLQHSGGVNLDIRDLEEAWDHGWMKADETRGFRAPTVSPMSLPDDFKMPPGKVEYVAPAVYQKTPVGVIEEKAEAFVRSEQDNDSSVASLRLCAKLGFQAGWRACEESRPVVQIDHELAIRETQAARIRHQREELMRVREILGDIATHSQPPFISEKWQNYCRELASRAYNDIWACDTAPDCKGCPDCKGITWKGPGD